MGIDEFKNPLVAEVLILLGSNSKRRIVVLEGFSDEALWKQHVDLAEFGASSVVAHGREKVVDCISEVYPKYPDRILGVVDRDYDIVQRLDDGCFVGVISSSLNDIELDILNLGRFSHCLHPSLSSSKLGRSDISVGDLEVFAVNAAAIVGSLRKLSRVRDLHLSFTCYDLKSRDFAINQLPSNDWLAIEKIADKYLIHKDNSHKIDDREEMLELCREYYEKTEEKIALCRGHDISDVFAILHNHFRKSGRSSRNGDDINDLLLGHISTAEFTSLDACKDLMGWLRLK